MINWRKIEQALDDVFKHKTKEELIDWLAEKRLSQLIINWKKPSEVPKENVPLFYNYDNGTMNYIDRGYYYAKTFKNWHYDTELNSEHIKSWCYEDELFETIPKEMM